jgi:hypothetical protein
MSPNSSCPGCRIELPDSGQPWDHRLGGSPECWLLYGDLIGYEMSNLAELGWLHQLCVDTYGAQHLSDGSGIRVPYSLVGLHLALDRGASGARVRALHQRMGRPDDSWPRFVPPSERGRITVLDVVRMGSLVDSIEGHTEAVQRWAWSVWEAWREQHDDVIALTDRLLRML